MIVRQESEVREVGAPRTYRPRDFSMLGGLRNIPDPLLEAHVTLYQGYVKNTNLLAERLKAAEVGSPEWAEMTRRIGFEVNGMRLHELYFDNLSSKGSDPSPSLFDALGGAWESFGEWVKEFKAMGLIRGVGWVILYRDPIADRLSNHWITLHEEGHPAGFTPLLVMDVWEHAFSGMDRNRYIEAFFENVHWNRVESRLEGFSGK
jgi:Fe-Mn family superoxide dismutase